MNKIRIMLVDDQELLREGLKTIINTQKDMEVVAEAGNGKAALELIETAKPDVVMMDIQMPIMNGVVATEAIKRTAPDTVIIILTTFDDDDFVVDALVNGAAGYLLKDISGPQLVRAIHDATVGQLLLPGPIAVKLASRVAQQSKDQPILRKDDLSLLNDRELEIGALMAKGMNNRQIAKALFLSEGTVKNYISEIYAKLGTSNRTQASILLRQINSDD